jgi:hypothetical protein
MSSATSPAFICDRSVIGRLQASAANSSLPAGVLKPLAFINALSFPICDDEAAASGFFGGLFGTWTGSTGVPPNVLRTAASNSLLSLNGTSAVDGGVSFIILKVSRNSCISEVFNDTKIRPAFSATAFGFRFASSQAFLKRSMFSADTLPSTFFAAGGCSSHSDFDHSDRQIPNRIDALRRKSPMSSLSRSGLSARTEPTPSIVLPRIVRYPHIVAMPFVSVIAGLPFTNSTGDQFQFTSTSMRIRLISACPTKSNVMPPRGSLPTIDGGPSLYVLVYYQFVSCA